MDRKKFAIILYAVLAALALVLAVAYGIDCQLVFAILFAVISVLNVVGLILGLKRKSA